VLSPQLFNIFINDLLIELKQTQEGASIGSYLFNSFAYANDVTLFCKTVPGLQCLINICDNYAKKWRFKFGVNKTKCMVIGANHLNNEPMWKLGGTAIENVASLEILGVVFESSCTSHVNTRVEKCRRSFYGLRDIGMSYPGLSSDVKSYLWNTMCQPVLLYGTDSTKISLSSCQKLETTQGNLIKQCLGLSKFSRGTHLLQAMRVKRTADYVKQSTASLCRRVFNVDSPFKDLCTYMLSEYISRGSVIPGTLIGRLVESGLSPVSCAFNRFLIPRNTESGIADSLRSLLMHENFIKPYSEQHVLAGLLTRAF
jgi:hypothetical protein